YDSIRNRRPILIDQIRKNAQDREAYQVGQDCTLKPPGRNRHWFSSIASECAHRTPSFELFRRTCRSVYQCPTDFNLNIAGRSASAIPCAHGFSSLLQFSCATQIVSATGYLSSPALY